MRRIFKWGLLAVMLVGVAYVSTCSYVNFVSSPSADAPVKIPEPTTAQYTVVIASNGNILFTSSYDKYGNVYVLHGYFELVGQEFIYRNRDIILDEAIMGKVTISQRAVPTPTGIQKPK